MSASRSCSERACCGRPGLWGGGERLVMSVLGPGDERMANSGMRVDRNATPLHVYDPAGNRLLDTRGTMPYGCRRSWPDYWM
ncbi:MAG: hypothetical protein HRU01_27925 [Myxococcales bacterium]|nr:hypothetical protein [Myxococcales bacterium]